MKQLRDFILVALVIVTMPVVAGELITDVEEPIPGKYIVVMKSVEGNQPGLVSQLVDSLSDISGLSIERVFSSALPGFVATMSEQRAAQLAVDPRVDYIEQDQVMRAIGNTQNDPTWGIDRVDERTLPLDGLYTYSTAAGNVHAYVIDTGINHSHVEFRGRIGNGENFITGAGGLLGGGLFGGGLFGGGGNNDPDTQDCNGHGTHVSGTLLGTTYGVAKRTTLHPVRVLDCTGSGSTSGVIAGVDWVTENFQRPAVANMSLGGGNSRALDDAVRNSVAAGITYAVAAGNNNSDACNGSPNRVAEAITVGATTSVDERSSFSNWGECVDMMAPGSNITSAWHTGDNATNTISGTSMASPHVAGAAALYLQANPNAAPSRVMESLSNNATSGQLSNLRGSPDRLLFTR